jgi:hypothetical protein
MATQVEGYAVCAQGQPLIGVVVNLYSVTDLETIVATTTTNSSGYYSFTGLADGDYIARIISGVIGTIGAERFTYKGGEWRWGTGTVGVNFTGVRIDQEGVRGYANNVVTFDLDATTGTLVQSGLDLDDIADGTTHQRLLATQISAGKIYLSDASTYKAGYDPSGKRRVFTATPTTPYDVGDLWLDATTVKRCTTARASGAYVAGDWTATTLDAITDGTTYSRVLTTSISAGKILLDETTAGTYGKVLSTDISAGHILLSACTGTLDNIANGTTYGKVALTGISAGKIVVAGLDSGVTARMFLDATTKNNIEAWRHASDVTMIDGGDIYANSITLTKVASEVTDRMFDSSAASDNIQGWPHASDVTKIDGGDIYTGSVTAAKITVATLSALSADMGTLTAGTIKMGTGTKDVNLTGFQLDSGEIVGQAAGVDQVYISAADGKLYAGAGAVVIGSAGIWIADQEDLIDKKLLFGNTAALPYSWLHTGPTSVYWWQLYAVDCLTNMTHALMSSRELGAHSLIRTQLSYDDRFAYPISVFKVQAYDGQYVRNILEVEGYKGDASGVFTGALSTYGYIYPGTGTAIQATGYITAHATGKLALMGGNVGIGTAAPNTKLEVSGTTRTARLDIAGAETYIYRLSANDLIFGSNSGDMITVSNNLLRPCADNVVALGHGSYRWSNLRVGTGTSYLMGNVGIGTTAPKSALHVVGLPVYANNAAAVAGGLTAGAFYRTNGDPDPVCVVH